MNIDHHSSNSPARRRLIYYLNSVKKITLKKQKPFIGPLSMRPTKQSGGTFELITTLTYVCIASRCS